MAPPDLAGPTDHPLVHALAGRDHMDALAQFLQSARAEPSAVAREPRVDKGPQSRCRRTARAIVGALALADEVRPGSKAAIDALHAQGVHVVMIAGDARPVAEAVRRELGVDEVFVEVLPEDKDSKVAELQARACGWPWSVTASTTPRPCPG